MAAADASPTPASPYNTSWTLPESVVGCVPVRVCLFESQTPLSGALVVGWLLVVCCLWVVTEPVVSTCLQRQCDTNYWRRADAVYATRRWLHTTLLLGYVPVGRFELFSLLMLSAVATVASTSSRSSCDLRRGLVLKVVRFEDCHTER